MIARGEQGGRRGAAQIILLGAAAPARLRSEVQSTSEVVTKSYFIDLSAYPDWLLVLVGTVLALLAIWILMKLLKWTLWILFFCVMIGGTLWAMSLLLG